MTVHEILETLMGYVEIYDKLYSQADATWRPLQDNVRNALLSLVQHSDAWRGYADTCRNYAPLIHSMTEVLAPPLDMWPETAKSMWESYGEMSAVATGKIEQISDWVHNPDDQSSTTQDRLQTLNKVFKAASYASERLRHQLIEEIKHLVATLEQRIPG